MCHHEQAILLERKQAKQQNNPQKISDQAQQSQPLN